jgi:hypothetical protein
MRTMEPFSMFSGASVRDRTPVRSVLGATSALAVAARAAKTRPAFILAATARWDVVERSS